MRPREVARGQRASKGDWARHKRLCRHSGRQAQRQRGREERARGERGRERGREERARGQRGEGNRDERPVIEFEGLRERLDKGLAVDGVRLVALPGHLPMAISARTNLRS